MNARLSWILGALLCLVAIAYGGFSCLFGLDGLVSGANVASWVEVFVVLVILPLAGLAFCVFRLVRPR
jgi:hypothetical protein